MKKIVNEQTGKTDVQFNAKLIDIAGDENVLENVNGTLYRPCTISFSDAQGQKRTASAIMYEKNYEKGVEKGNTYLATASEGDERGAIISVSAIAQAERVDNSAFDFSSAKVEEEASSDERVA